MSNRDPEKWKKQQYSYWMFTIDLHERPNIDVPWHIPPGITAAIKALKGQHEIGDNNGRLHFQGYMELKKRDRFNKVKEVFTSCDLGWVHIEPRFGTHEEAIAYVSKTETRVQEPWATVQYGAFTPECKVTPTGRGKTSLNQELRKLSAEILSGRMSLTEATCAHPELVIRFSRGLSTLPAVFQEIQATKKRKVKLFILWGDPGTGKTTHAEYMHYSNINENGTQNGIYYLPDYSSPNGGLPWHTGYNGEKTIIADEFDSQLSLTQLNDYVCGRARQTAQVKGGSVYLLHEALIIISNKSPEMWWNGLGATKHAVFDEETGTTKLVHDVLFIAFMRRVTQITHFKAAPDLREHLRQYVTRDHTVNMIGLAEVRELEEKNKKMIEISEKVQAKRTRELMEALTRQSNNQEDEDATNTATVRQASIPRVPEGISRRNTSTSSLYSDDHCGQPPDFYSWDDESEQDLFGDLDEDGI